MDKCKFVFSLKPLKRLYTTDLCLLTLGEYHPRITSKHGIRRRDGLHVRVSKKTDNDLALTQLIDRTNRDSGAWAHIETDIAANTNTVDWALVTICFFFLLLLVLLLCRISSFNQGHQVHLDPLPQLLLSNQAGPKKGSAVYYLLSALFLTLQETTLNSPCVTCGVPSASFFITSLSDLPPLTCRLTAWQVQTARFWLAPPVFGFLRHHSFGPLTAVACLKSATHQIWH